MYDQMVLDFITFIQKLGGGGCKIPSPPPPSPQTIKSDEDRLITWMRLQEVVLLTSR